jgi:simple sugar transport system ATP-binding protein
VLLISFELDEIFGLSDRILVMYEGIVTLETRPDLTDESELGLAMTGGRGSARAEAAP